MQIISRSDGDAGELLLYGVIGYESPWWDDDDKEEDLTAIEFRKAFKDLESRHSRINIRINSPGGFLFDGNGIISTILSSSAEVHTYNDGMAASMAFGIWMAAPHRHMAINALSMVHNSVGVAIGNAQDIRDYAGMLDKFTATTVSLISKMTGMEEDEVSAQFFDDYKDHWLTYQECLDIGLVTETEEYETKPAGVSNVQQMSYAQLIKQFQDMQKEERKSTPFWRRAAAIFAGSSNNSKTREMNLSEFKKSITDGDLSMEDVNCVLEEMRKEPAAATPGSPEKLPDSLEERIASIESSIDKLTEHFTRAFDGVMQEIKQFGEAPGAQPLKPAAVGDVSISGAEMTIEELYKKDLEMYAQAADRWDTPFSGPLD